MEVTTIYELPVPIWVSCETLGQTFSSGCEQVRFKVVMPQDVAPVGAAPTVQGVEFPEGPDGEQTVWAQEYGADIDESARPATALVRVVITAVEAEPNSARPWAGPDDQLVAVIETWFDRIRTWVEIFTGQDLDPRHRTYDAEIVGGGLTFIVPASQGAVSLIASVPKISPLPAAHWKAILSNVRDGKEPPLEEVLSRDARAALKRGSHRRAVVDAATAVEVALARAVREQAGMLPEPQRGRLDLKPAFGTYIDIAEKSGITFDVTFEDLRGLSTRRNDAAHRGEAPSALETSRLVRTATAFLAAHGVYKRVAKPAIVGPGSGPSVADQTSAAHDNAP